MFPYFMIKRIYHPKKMIEYLVLQLLTIGYCRLLSIIYIKREKIVFHRFEKDYVIHIPLIVKIYNDYYHRCEVVLIYCCWFFHWRHSISSGWWSRRALENSESFTETNNSTMSMYFHSRIKLNNFNSFKNHHSEKFLILSGVHIYVFPPSPSPWKLQV